MRQKRLFALIMPLLCALILASCSSTVSQEDYAALTAERDALKPDAESYARFRERLGAIECEARKRADDLETASARQMKKTVVVITHNQALTAMADRIITVKSGQIRSMELNDHIVPVDEIDW